MPGAVPEIEASLMMWLAEKQKEYLAGLRDMGRLINLNMDNRFVKEHGDDFTTKLILETYFWRNRLNYGPAVEFKIGLRSGQKIPERHLTTLDELFYDELRKDLPKAHFDYDVDDNYFGICMRSDYNYEPEVRDKPDQWPDLFSDMSEIFRKLTEKYISLTLSD